eukprot:2683066-Rhodomonas_salina.1
MPADVASLASGAGNEDSRGGGHGVGVLLMFGWEAWLWFKKFACGLGADPHFFYGVLEQVWEVLSRFLLQGLQWAFSPLSV